MRIEGTLAVAGVGGGVLLWSQAAHLAGYGFGAAAFLSLGGIQSGVRALRAYNRYSRGTEGEDAVLHALRGLPEGYTAVANFVAPGTRQGTWTCWSWVRRAFWSSRSSLMRAATPATATPGSRSTRTGRASPCAAASRASSSAGARPSRTIW